MTTEFPYISVELTEGLGKQVFQLSALLHMQNNRTIIFEDENCLSRLFQDQFYVLPNYDYRRISFTQITYDTDLQHPTEQSKHNMMLKGAFQTFKCMTEGLRKKMINLVYSNHDLMYKAYDKYNEIKRYFGEDTSDNDMICMHVKINTSADKSRLYLDYYKKALQIAGKKFVVVFSDDIEWCKKNVAKNLYQYEKIYFVDTRELPETDEIDFLVMSMFQHHILANSSFSLWASFISAYDNDEQLIIAPTDWYHEKQTITIHPIYHKKISHII
jgi:hypothetical protein